MIVFFFSLECVGIRQAEAASVRCRHTLCRQWPCHVNADISNSFNATFPKPFYFSHLFTGLAVGVASRVGLSDFFTVAQRRESGKEAGEVMPDQRCETYVSFRTLRL